jgi:hypothetical protein
LCVCVCVFVLCEVNIFLLFIRVRVLHSFKWYLLYLSSRSLLYRQGVVVYPCYFWLVDLVNLGRARNLHSVYAVSSAGHYVPSIGSTAQLSCPVGTFSTSGFASACDPVPAGFRGNTFPSTDIISCEPGTYSSLGDGACTLAPLGMTRFDEVNMQCSSFCNFRDVFSDVRHDCAGALSSGNDGHRSWIDFVHSSTQT